MIKVLVFEPANAVSKSKEPVAIHHYEDIITAKNAAFALRNFPRNEYIFEGAITGKLTIPKIMFGYKTVIEQ